jgi:RIO-like serine/threonine protein kinase
MTNYIKKIKYSKSNKTSIYNEIELHMPRAFMPKQLKEQALVKYVSNKYTFCPKIISYDFFENHAEIIMENINGKTLYELFSDTDNIPTHIWESIRTILNILFYEEGIEYIDISPFNFIVKNNIVYIIDFGHAYWFNENKKISNWFLKKFIVDEENNFNPDFK